MHSIEKNLGHKPSTADISPFGQCVIMSHQSQRTAIVGHSQRAQSNYQLAWARAISTFMALDLKEQTYSSAGMPISSADDARSSVAHAAIQQSITQRKSGCP
jgi:hypothetical protein